MCTAVGSPAGAIMTGVGLSILAPSVMSGIKGYKLSQTNDKMSKQLEEIDEQIA